MKQLYILVICLCVSLGLIANQLNEDVDSVKNERSAIKNDVGTTADKEQSSVMPGLYQVAFLVSISLNVCLLFVIYKKNIKITKLRKEKEDCKWKVYAESDSFREQMHRGSGKEVPRQDCVTKVSSDFFSEQQEIVIKEDEKSETIDFTLDKGKEYRYLTPSYQGKFTRLFDVPSSKTRFRCWEENNVWKFEFHGDLKTAIENFNATFDETCVVEGSYKGATRYETEPGTLDKELNIKSKSIIRLY